MQQSCLAHVQIRDARYTHDIHLLETILFTFVVYKRVYVASESSISTNAYANSHDFSYAETWQTGTLHIRLSDGWLRPSGIVNIVTNQERLAVLEDCQGEANPVRSLSATVLW